MSRQPDFGNTPATRDRMGTTLFQRCVSRHKANLEFTGLSFAEITLAKPNQSNTAFASEPCLKGIASFRTHGPPAVPVAAWDSDRPGRVGPGRVNPLKTCPRRARIRGCHLTSLQT